MAPFTSDRPVVLSMSKRLSFTISRIHRNKSPYWLVPEPPNDRASVSPRSRSRKSTDAPSFADKEDVGQLPSNRSATMYPNQLFNKARIVVPKNGFISWATRSLYCKRITSVMLSRVCSYSPSPLTPNDATRAAEKSSSVTTTSGMAEKTHRKIFSRNRSCPSSISPSTSLLTASKIEKAASTFSSSICTVNGKTSVPILTVRSNSPRTRSILIKFRIVCGPTISSKLTFSNVSRYFRRISLRERSKS
mmetsp:Transcript_19295/g.39098  ORF Transcript_19295/g.39098 Transcript_19295/m.39098 type:complete len:248 (+) Transcript_19295:3214-3957(+)